MKLNNRGFAITAVLYGILILFVFLIGSYLMVLSAKKDRVEDLVSEIENDYRNLDDESEEESCPTLPENIEFPYQIQYNGTYTFNITSFYGSTNICSIYLETGDNVYFAYNTLYLYNDSLDNPKEEIEIPFDDQDCYDLLYHKNVASVNSLVYLCQ